MVVEEYGLQLVMDLTCMIIIIITTTREGTYTHFINLLESRKEIEQQQKGCDFPSYI